MKGTQVTIVTETSYITNKFFMIMPKHRCNPKMIRLYITDPENIISYFSGTFRQWKLKILKHFFISKVVHHLDISMFFFISHMLSNFSDRFIVLLVTLIVYFAYYVGLLIYTVETTIIHPLLCNKPAKYAHDHPSSGYIFILSAISWRR